MALNMLSIFETLSWILPKYLSSFCTRGSASCQAALLCTQLLLRPSIVLSPHPCNTNANQLVMVEKQVHACRVVEP